jgi:hypothetical protein
MDGIKALLLPTGVGILLVVMVFIGEIMASGRRAAREGPGPLAAFLTEFIEVFVLVILILAIFGAIRGAAS